MARLRNFVAEQAGLGTGKMSVRCLRHRKDGVPKKLCGSVRWSRHR